MSDDWQYALEETVNELLEDCGITEPPVDAFRLAADLRLEVVFDESQPTRGRHKRLGGHSTVFLRPDERPERNHWALAHEIGENIAWRIAERLGQTETLPAGSREDLANKFASRLLLPTRWFPADAAIMDDDLFALKRRYATASHELIAMRLLDRETPGVVTIFDHGRTTCRRSNTGGTPPLLAEERAAAHEAHHSGSTVVRETESCRVRAWPVHEPHWKREILWTTFVEDFAMSFDEW